MIVGLIGIAVAVALAVGDEPDPQRFCDAYVQCVAVATLEERVCLGNSKWRPYWLPPRQDPHSCHNKLRNDYILMERMEQENDSQMVECLNRNNRPFTDEEKQVCDDRALRSASLFSFGRCIDYVPTNCFMGTEKRIEAKCSKVKECCPALSSCSSMRSQMAKQIEDVRQRMVQRASDCENGVPIDRLPLDATCYPTAYSMAIDDGQSGGETFVQEA